ncbi:MAG: inositol monophosphatase family protein, partial [Myxococcota bacterium]|nr:inositol monophosphatase family protein [Myxococcota bacterium]
AGVVAVPVLGQLFRAQQGLGAWCNETPIRAMEQAPPADRAFVCLSRNAHQYLHVSGDFRVLSMGSTASNFVQVARGTVMGAVGRSHCWDHVAPAAIIGEAGGVIRHLDGQRVDWLTALDGTRFDPPLLASSGALWDRVAEGVTNRS